MFLYFLFSPPKPSSVIVFLSTKKNRMDIKTNKRKNGDSTGGLIGVWRWTTRGTEKDYSKHPETEGKVVNSIFQPEKILISYRNRIFQSLDR